MNKLKPKYLSAAIVTTLSLMSATAAQSAVVEGTIYQQVGGATNVSGTTIDYYDITLAANGVLEIDMLAMESYSGSLAIHPGGLVDLNEDGEHTALDGHIRLFPGTNYAAEVGIADDSSAYTPPGNSNGWADGSISSRDSYLLLGLNAGTYRLAVSDYNMTRQDVIDGFNPTDTLLNGRTHADYTLAINAYADYDFDDNGNPVIGNSIAVAVSQVPVPSAVWLFGSAIAGFGSFRSRKKS